MNRTDLSPQPLRLTPPMWIALGAIALIGLARWTDDQTQLRCLDLLEGDQVVILRSTGQAHAFPSLGIKIVPPEGWSYLSVTDDAVADRLVFVNESANSIFSLRRFGFRSWPPIEREVETRQYEHVTIAWIEADHRRLGRLTQGDVDLTIVVITHVKRSKLNDSIDELCNAIRIISADDSR